MIFNTNIEFTLEYTVKKIIMRLPSGDYLLSVKVKSFKGYPKKAGFPKEMEAVGKFHVVNVGDTFISKARFHDTGTFGYRFELSGVPEVVLPSTAAETAKFLKEHVRGLGQKGAEAIVEKIGVSAITDIPQHPELLDGIKNLTNKTKESVINWCTDNTYFETVIFYLYQQGVPVSVTKYLYEKFKGSTLERLNANPYLLYDAVKMPFPYVEKIAKNLNYPWNSEERLLCAIRAAVDTRIISNGDSCVLKQNIVSYVEQYLKRSKNYYARNFRETSQMIFTQEHHQAAIQKLVDKGYFIEIKRPYATGVNIYCYPKATYECETSAAKRVIELLQRKPPIAASKATIRAYLDEQNWGLIDEQKEGIITAATNAFSVLTGGPGTGKTYTMKALVATLRHFRPNIRILQVAPTSKAAARMREVTGLDADTIHSRFKLATADMLHSGDDDYEVDADIVIVDESSMISSEIFNKMIHKVRGNTCFLFVGDDAQLPSIEYGAVLRGLIQSKMTCVPFTELNQVHRQSAESMIVTNAHIIRNQDVNEIDNIQFRDKDFQLIIANNEENVSDMVINTVKDLVKNKHVPLDNMLVLTPVHATMCGTEALNSRLRELLNPKAQTNRKCYVVDGIKTFFEGDRVINTCNIFLKDAEGKKKKIRNGDKGYIVSITDKTIEVARDNDDDIIVFTKAKIQYLDLAYAITVHKSQGSEADYVILPVLDTRIHKHMLTKELLYTAVTRTKKKFICIGTKESFIDACKPSNLTLEKQREDVVHSDNKRLSLFPVFLVKEAKKAGLIA